MWVVLGIEIFVLFKRGQIKNLIKRVKIKMNKKYKVIR